MSEELKTATPNTRGSALAMLACVAVILIWFSPWWLGGKNLAPLDLLNGMMSPWSDPANPQYASNHAVADAVDQYLVYRMVAAEDYAREGQVGWSSLTYGGTAQYANTMALYDDWSMQLHRWLGFWTAWHLGLLGQVALAAGGMFLFLRGRNIGSLWAGCGALAYAANSQFVTWIYHRWALGSFCWVPWALWAIDSYRAGKRGFWPLVPLFLAMAFMGGTLQHAALVVLAVLAMWAEETFRSGRQHKAQLTCLGRYTAWGLLACGLSAMMLVPCIAAFLESNRLGLHTGLNVNAENSIYPEGVLQPVLNLLAYPFQVFPSVLGRSDSVDALKAFKSKLFYVFYFGSLPVLLAFLAMVRKGVPTLARILIFAGLILPLTPLVRYLYQRLYLLFILGGILAFTHFMQTADRATRLRVFKATGIFASLAIAAWLILSVGLMFSDYTQLLKETLIQRADGSSFGHYTEWIALRIDRFIDDIPIWSRQQILPLGLFVLALAGLRFSASLGQKWRQYGAVLVACAVLAEVSLFASRWVVWSDPETQPLFPTTAESEVLKEQVGRDGRVTTLIHPTGHMPLTPFVPNTLSAYGVPIIGGYDSIVPDGMILPNETPGDAEKLGRYGVSHLITWPGNPDVPGGWRRLWDSPAMELYANELALPRYVAFRTEREKDDFIAGNARAHVPVRETTGRQNTRHIEVPAGSRWVRIAENQADGWEYKLADSDSWLPVLRAADASMLMAVNSGGNGTTIEMRYRPPLRRLGFQITGASLLLLTIGTTLVVRRKNQTAPAT